MKLLALDCSTETLSVAVCSDAQTWAQASPGGAQASGSLLPLIQHLLRQAGLSLQELDAIAFGQGPGSFTGLRTACAVAQGLALGAARPVLPVPTLLAVAEEARFRHGSLRVVAALDARMGEIYSARFDFDSPTPWLTTAELLTPEQLQVPAGFCLAGNLPDGLLPVGITAHAALPTAPAMLRLAPALLAAGLAVDAAQAWPLYIRDKVAKTTQERLADKAAHHLAQQA